MSFLSRIAAGARALFNRERVNRELTDEVNHYLDQAIAVNIAAGMSRSDAERAARARMGTLASVQEPARSYGWDVSLEAVMQDLRYAVRYLAKSPGFTVAAVLSLALGIGANTAIFSMVNATLIRRLPVERSSELVSVGSPSPSGVFSYPSFDDLRRTNTSLADLAAFAGITVSMSDDDATDLTNGIIVTGNYFGVLGVKAERGRVFSPDDDRTPGAHSVIVISGRLWKQRFGKRSDIVGLGIRLNGQPFTIIGVTPSEFQGTQPGAVGDFFVPMMMQAWMRPPRGGYSGEMNPDLLTARGRSWLFAIGRLKPDVSIEQGTAAMTATMRGMGDWTSADASAPQPSALLTHLDDGPPGQRAQLTSVARLLGGVVFAVLIIACANVANLLLARATSRRKEIAVRLGDRRHAPPPHSPAAYRERAALRGRRRTGAGARLAFNHGCSRLTAPSRRTSCHTRLCRRLACPVIYCRAVDPHRRGLWFDPGATGIAP